MNGSLWVAGAGIQMVSHVTLQTRGLIRHAQKLLFLVSEPGTAAWLRRLQPGAESLDAFFLPGRSRQESYERMLDHIASRLRDGCRLGVLLYGHPAVFSYLGPEAVRRARAAGCEAEMLPGISAEDCLFADLGAALDFDLSTAGYQCFEATLFLLQHRRPDPLCALILWQIGIVGQYQYELAGPNRAGLQLLAAELLRYYPAGHQVICYEAANFPACPPSIQPMPLHRLPAAKITRLTTLLIPPAAAPPRDGEMAKKLGLPEA